MTRTARKMTLVGLLALGVLATACSPQATPVPSAAPSETAVESEAPSVTPSVAPSIIVEPSIDVAPSEEPAPSEAAGAEGIALGDVDVQLLIDAYTGYGFTFGDLVTEEDGTTYYSGDHGTDDVRVVLVVNGDSLSHVNLYDFSAGDGIDEMGFTIGIFAPESQPWLVEQLETAIADEGTAFTATESFEHVSLILNAYTDDAQSLDMIVTE